MNTLADRINRALQEAGKNQTELAAYVGIKTPSVNAWVSGDTKTIKGENLLRAAAFLNVRAEWLSNGKGDMRPNPAAQTIPPNASIAAYADHRELDEEKYVKVKSYSVGLSAGAGNVVWVEYEDDPLVFRASFFKARNLKPEHCKALRVQGRSMEPYLDDGDTVMIDTHNTRIIDGEIYAVMVGEELYIKHIERLPGGIRLRSANETFRPIDLNTEQLEQFKVLGKKEWRAG